MYAYYAQLDENNICIGISMLKEEVNQPNMVKIPEYNDDYLYRKYENGFWSVEKIKPETNSGLSGFEQLRADVDQIIIDLLSGV